MTTGARASIDMFVSWQEYWIMEVPYIAFPSITTEGSHYGSQRVATIYFTLIMTFKIHDKKPLLSKGLFHVSCMILFTYTSVGGNLFAHFLLGVQMW